MRRFLKLLSVTALLLLPSSSSAATRRAAVRKPATVKTARIRKPRAPSVSRGSLRNGKATKGYIHTAPDNTERNNSSAKGNLNPITGKPGTKIPKK
jgi:hypothetical protein